MSGASFDVVVIGAGANGLIAAARLAKGGRRVLVLDASPDAGGQGRLVEFAPGFRAAPLAIDPGWLPAGLAREAGLAVPPATTVPTPLSVATGSGGFLTLPRDPARAAEAIAAHSAGDAAKWGAFTSRLRNLAGFLEELYVRPAPDVDVSLRELPSLFALGRKFRALGRQDMFELLRTLPLSVWELADDWFETPALKAAIASGGVVDLQQGPRSGGTGFVLLHHLVGTPSGSIRGRVPWRDQPSAFTDAAVAAARQAGATIRFGARVNGIAVHDDAVTGVVLEGGEQIPTKLVLSTADPARTILDWIDPVWLDPEDVRKMQNVRHRGCTGYVIYALDALPSIRGLAPEALAGIVSLTPDLVSMERAADATKYGTIAERPHVELHAPTLLWPSLAPAGRHVLIARAHYVPFASRDAFDPRVDAAIESVAPGFDARILHRVVWSPRDLEERFGLREGAASQGELALDQILFMRPVAGWGRHATPLTGLYLGGAGTHPGPGILGGAGWLAAERIA